MIAEPVVDTWVEPDLDGRIYGYREPTPELTLIEQAPAAPTRDERRARLLDTAHRIRPVTLAEDQRLPVVGPLESVLPDGLRRGTTVGLSGPGGRSLLLSLAGEATRTGSWLVLVGMTEVGLAAAVEQDVAIQRVAVVAAPQPDEWATVVGALIGDVDLVAVAPSHRVRPGDVRRLRARSRERGSVLAHVGSASSWPVGHDLQIHAGRHRWSGLCDGHGRLEEREVVINYREGSRPSRPGLLTL